MEHVPLSDYELEHLHEIYGSTPEEKESIRLLAVETLQNRRNKLTAYK